MKELIANVKLKWVQSVRQIAPAAGNVIQFDRRNGINSRSWPPHTSLKHSFPLILILVFPCNSVPTHSLNSILSPLLPASFSLHFFFFFLFSSTPPVVLLSIATFPSFLRLLYRCVSLCLSPSLHRVSHQLPALCLSLCWQTPVSGPARRRCAMNK